MQRLWWCIRPYPFLSQCSVTPSCWVSHQTTIKEVIRYIFPTHVVAAHKGEQYFLTGSAGKRHPHIIEDCSRHRHGIGRLSSHSAAQRPLGL